MYEFPSIRRHWFFFFLQCQNNSIYKCFHEPWGSYCSVCSNVGLGQQLSWKNETNPGPKRQTGLIKHSGVRKTLKNYNRRDPCFAFHQVFLYLCHFPTDLLFYYELFKRGHFTSTISFQRKGNRRKWSQVKQRENCSSFGRMLNACSCIRARACWWFLKSPFVLSPLDPVYRAAQTPISNRENMQISELLF